MSTPVDRKPRLTVDALMDLVENYCAAAKANNAGVTSAAREELRRALEKFEDTVGFTDTDPGVMAREEEDFIMK